MIAKAPRARSNEPRVALDDAYARHERLLWGLCYRMTGSAADAEDLVQETFARALERPPADASDAAALRPWLVRVAVNLARDHLRARRRRRRDYVGPWLPSPIETAPEDVAATRPDAEARYAMLESVTFAFLLALEALTAQQRAVLLLRDVFDLSVDETATALALTEGNVKTTHHRARARMAAYDHARAAPTPALREATRDALTRFFAALTAEDADAARATLSDLVTSRTDGGGEFTAARVPVVGSDLVARFYLKLARVASAGATFEIRDLNGLPAVIASVPSQRPPFASRFAMLVTLAPDGRIGQLDLVLASAKLGALRFP